MEIEEPSTAKLAAAFAKYRTPEDRKLDRRARDMMEQQRRRAAVLQGKENIRRLELPNLDPVDEPAKTKYVPIIGVRG